MVVAYLGKGISHELDGAPCQDALGGCRAQNGNLILVLSDGAGRARRGGLASRSIVDTVINFFGRMPLAEFLAIPEGAAGKTLLDACNGELRKLAKAMQEPDLRQFSATLAFAVLADGKLLVGHLGDGLSLVLDDMGETMLYCAPDRGSAGGNSTWFTVSPTASERLCLKVLEADGRQPALLALTSDGPMDMLCGRGDGDAVETVRELLGYIRCGELRSDADLADVLNQMAEITQERMDDWSVVLWSPYGDHEDLPMDGVCHSMLREEEEKYGIGESEENCQFFSKPGPGDVV